MTLDQGVKLVAQLRAAVDGDKLREATTILQDLKLILTEFESLPPLNVRTPNAQKERALGREVLELAVFLSVKLDFADHSEKKKAFQRHIAQLLPYYLDQSIPLPQSQLQGPIIGLNLLYLLVENRLAEFHSVLELLSDAERASTYVKFPTQLEQFLMVGAYDKVLDSRKLTPHPIYGYFMSLLVDTVRDAVAECSEVAYESLSVGAAKSSLLLESDDAVRRYAEEKHVDWKIEGGKIYFGKTGEQKHVHASDLPSLKLISEALSYATELERIV